MTDKTPETKGAGPAKPPAKPPGNPSNKPKSAPATGSNAGPPAQPRKPVVKTEPVKRPGGPHTADATRAKSPVTAGDYARTTSNSPENTAVIPVVRDEAAQKSKSGTTTRQASLKVIHVDPWSVSKVVFALTVAMMIVAVVAVTILWVVLSFAGVWDQINSSVTTVLSDDSSSFDITHYLGFGRIVGLTLILSAINVVITTAVATIGAYLYNLAAQLVGGLDVTLAEED